MQRARSYEIGTCFFCMKCMYCAKNLKETTCNCNKSVKPNKNNRTKEVKFYRSCSYFLNNGDDTYTKSVQESVTKFGYEIDLNKSFNYTLCSSCNGKTYRKKKKLINNSSIDLESPANSLPSSATNSIPTSPSTTYNDLPIPETEESLLPDSPLNPFPSSFDKSDILSTFNSNSLSLSHEQFKFKLQIKNNNVSSQPSSLVVMEERPFDLYALKEKICEILDEKYGLMNYGEFKMIYKAENSYGAGNWLDNENEFKEFLNYYDKLKKTTKMVLIIINVQSKRKVIIIS
jgi:hypothetical protein